MNRLKELREERGLSVRKLSELIGIKFESISRYENEKRDISTDLLKMFSNYFEVSIDYLLGHSAYYIYLRYNRINLKVNEDNYKSLFRNGLIYFDDSNHRCIKLNELIGLDDCDNDLSDMIEDLYRNKRFNDLFDKNSFGVVNEDVILEIINDSEIVLDRQFVMFMRECVKG